MNSVVIFVSSSPADLVVATSAKDCFVLVAVLSFDVVIAVSSVNNDIIVSVSIANIDDVCVSMKLLLKSNIAVLGSSVAVAYFTVAPVSKDSKLIVIL